MYSGWRQINRRINGPKTQPKCALPWQGQWVYAIADRLLAWLAAKESNDLARIVKIDYNLGAIMLRIYFNFLRNRHMVTLLRPVQRNNHPREVPVTGHERLRTPD